MTGTRGQLHRLLHNAYVLPQDHNRPANKTTTNLMHHAHRLPTTWATGNENRLATKQIPQLIISALSCIDACRRSSHYSGAKSTAWRDQATACTWRNEYRLAVFKPPDSSGATSTAWRPKPQHAVWRNENRLAVFEATGFIWRNEHRLAAEATACCLAQ